MRQVVAAEGTGAACAVVIGSDVCREALGGAVGVQGATGRMDDPVDFCEGPPRL